MLTGLLPEEHGARDLRDPLEERFTTLPELYAAAGYETVAFVTNFGAVGRAAGFAQGFETFHELATRPYTRARELGRLVSRRIAARDDERPIHCASDDAGLHHCAVLRRRARAHRPQNLVTRI
jgi:hypothetical protein